MKRFIILLLAVIVGSCAFSSTVFAAEPAVSAESYVLINADTLEVLSSKNMHKTLSMASTTKLMTALLLYESGELDDTVTASENAVTVEGTSMGLHAGDVLTKYALLVGMLLQSGNDAANVSAEAVSGNIPDFAELMNKKAAALGMKDTHFVTPSGLDAEGHYTTAYDMSLLAAEVLKRDGLSNIVSSKSLTVNVNDKPVTYYNHNKLLSQYDACIGLKTGYTVKSGRCLVTAARRNGASVICVTLKDSDDYADHKRLLEYGLSCLRAENKEFNIDDTVDIVGGEADKVRLSYDKLTVGVSGKEDCFFTASVTKPPFLYAPVSAGSVIGSVTYKYGDHTVKTVPLTVDEDVDKVFYLPEDDTESILIRSIKEILRFI